MFVVAPDEIGDAPVTTRQACALNRTVRALLGEGGACETLGASLPYDASDGQYLVDSASVCFEQGVYTMCSLYHTASFMAPYRLRARQFVIECRLQERQSAKLQLSGP